MKNIIILKLENLLQIVLLKLGLIYPFLFFKSTIYYMGHNGSPCLQKELCMEYQYSDLFIQLPNIKDY